ncbi:MAG: EamA family transporter [Burkholderiaceae bacterium]|nr:EamA family transporter [Burkholderiaceae bacterium]
MDPRPSHQAAPLPPLVGAALLLLVATAFASNHIAARLAFDHGTSVATAVATRSITTVVVVLALLLASGASLRPPAGTPRRALLVGVLLSVQSYCLYAAVARLPVALALLTFNVFPILLALVAWVAGGQRPGRRTLLAMPVILLGLALALDVVGAGARPVAGSRAAGIAFALAASSTFAVALYLTTRWLGAMDGRLRAVLTMATVAVVVLALGGLVDLLGLATDAAGRPLRVFTLPTAPAGWLGLVLLSLLYTLAFTTLFGLLPRLGAVNNAPILNFEPIAALALGSVVLGQRVLPIQVLGAFLVVGAIVYLTTGRAR